MRKITIKDAQIAAQKHNGRCLSKNYKSMHEKLTWQCKYGHVWKSCPVNILLKKTWCPKCSLKNRSDKRRSNIKRLQDLAKNNNGECLSKIYINMNIKYEWKCFENHKWQATGGSVQSGSWCPVCAGKNKTINDMQELAQKKNGICLSKKYKHSHSKLKWKCKENHIWHATPTSIKSNCWCPYCVGQGKKTIKDMRKMAKENGGRCLSQKYIKANVKLKWKCINGHTWKATPNSIKTGSWCPHCKTGLCEKFCRAIFENMFNESFPKTRPDWLVSPKTGAKLELDGYCEKLQIAFEHNGRHHYFENVYKDTLLKNIQYNDNIKIKLCNKYKVKLFSIPELFSLTKLKNINCLLKNFCDIYNLKYKEIDIFNILKICRKQIII